MLAGAWAVSATSLPFAPAWWRAALAQCLTKRQRRLPVSPDFRSSWLLDGRGLEAADRGVRFLWDLHNPSEIALAIRPPMSNAPRPRRPRPRRGARGTLVHTRAREHAHWPTDGCGGRKRDDHTNNTTPVVWVTPADTSSRGTAPQNKNTTPCSVGHVPTHVRRVLSPARCRRARRPPYSLVRRSPDLRPISARTDACPHPDLVTARTSKVSSDIPHSSGIPP